MSFMRRHVRARPLVDYVQPPAPLSLSDRQLDLVMTAVGSLPPEKRSVLLDRLAGTLRHGLRRPTDADVEGALRKALESLSQQPAA